jgi:hypothetical protein
MEQWELVARERIRELVAEYAHCADSGRFDDFAALFELAGVLEVRGDEPVRGREAIRAFLRGVGTQLASASAVPIIRHHVSNLKIDVASPTEARGVCYFLAMTEHGVDHWGRYRDRYVPDGDRWVFEHRYVRTDGTTAGGWAESRQKG